MKPGFRIHEKSQQKFDRAVEGLKKTVKLKEREILDMVAEFFLSGSRTSSPIAKKKKRAVYPVGRKGSKVYPGKAPQVARYSSKKNASDLPKHVRYKLNRGIGRESWNQLARILDLKPGKSQSDDARDSAKKYVRARRKNFPFAVIEFSNGVRSVSWSKGIMSKGFGKAVRRLHYEFKRLAKELEDEFAV